MLGWVWGVGSYLVLAAHLLEGIDDDGEATGLAHGLGRVVGVAA